MLGLMPGLRPDFVVDGKPEKLSMVFSISLVTLAATALILFVSKVKPDAVVTGSVMKAGVVAVISILGIAWLGSTFFESHQTEILGAISAYVKQYPWLFSVALFLLSILLYSQAATVAALMPVGLQLGIGSAAADRHVPGCQRLLLFADLCHDRRRNSVRLHWDDGHRPVGAEP